MARFVRLTCTVALAAWVAACGTEPAGIPSAATGPLDATAFQCPVPDAADIIGEIFPDPGLQNQALAKCRNVVRQADRDLEAAVGQAFDFLGQTLELYYDGTLADPSAGTLEEAIADLFAALFDAIGVEGPALGTDDDGNLDAIVGVIDETGGTLTVPSLHSAIHFEPGDLLGDTFVSIALLPGPAEPGECPFGFEVPNDCYPLFFDYTLTPESNLVGVPRIGQCVVEPPDPFAPPSETVEDRLRIASPDHDNPGEIVFWPLATAPGTVDCSDLETPALGDTGFGDALWAGLGPMQRLFSVSAAYANPGKLGASVSTFTPFAPTDPETGGSIEVTVLNDQEPYEGATVTVEMGETLVASGTSDANGEVTFTDVPFGTYDVSASDFDAGLASGIEEVTLSSETPNETVTLDLLGIIE